MGTKLAVSIAAGFHAAKRQMNLRTCCGSVDIDQAGFDITHKAEGIAQIIGKNGGGEAIFSGVCYLHRFLVGGYRQDRDERAKNLFTGNTHVRADISKNRGLVEGSLAVLTCVEGGTAG